MCALQPLAEYRSANADGHMREQYVLGPRASAPRAGSFCSGSLFRQTPDLSQEHVGAHTSDTSHLTLHHVLELLCVELTPRVKQPPIVCHDIKVLARHVDLAQSKTLANPTAQLLKGQPPRRVLV